MNNNISISSGINSNSHDAFDYSVIWHIITLGLFTGLALELTNKIFKLDKDLGQMIIYPVVLLLFLYILRKQLTKTLVIFLLSTLFLLVFSFFWIRGDFGLSGGSYISQFIVGAANPELEKLRVNFNREAELLRFSQLQALYRSFDDNSADLWGKDRNKLLIYADSDAPKLKLFLAELNSPQRLTFNGFELQIKLFPEWVPINKQGVPIDYLTTLSRVLPILDTQKDRLKKLIEISFTGYAAGKSVGKWYSPVPRAAALLMGASANLARDNLLSKREVACIQKELFAVLKKIDKTNSPELSALALNNLGVAILKLNAQLFTVRSIISARKMFARAASIRSVNGRVVDGARLAAANLFALDGAGLSPVRRVRPVQKRIKKRVKKQHF